MTTDPTRPPASRAILALALVAGLIIGVASLVGPAPSAGAFDVHDPIGSLDSGYLGRNQGGVNGLTWGDGKWYVRGWAADVDAPSTWLQVHVYVNDTGYITNTGSLVRPDVQAAYPWAGPTTGFVAGVDARAGDRVCAYAINIAAGLGNTPLGCWTVPPFGSTDPGDPFGALDEASAEAQTIRLRGWAADPDQPALPLFLNISVDGSPLTTLYAQDLRTDVAAAFPGFGAAHGYDQRVPVEPGRHTVCVAAINVGTGGINNVNLGCPILDVPPTNPPPGQPRGAIDLIRESPLGNPVGASHWAIGGWDWDPRSSETDLVKVRYQVVSYVGFRVSDWSATVATGVSRPDVAAAFPAAGTTTGWAWAGDLRWATIHHACAYAVPADPALSEVLLGCRLA